MEKTELRLDPLTGAWTIFSESRALPPDFGSTLGEDLPPSPFQAGRERYASHTLYQANGDYGWQVRVVPNRLPVLRVEGDGTPQADGSYDHLDGVGAHEVIVEDPGDRRLEDLPVADVAKVIQAWQSRITDLRHDIRLRSFFIVKNTGRAAGQTVAHSLSQLLAMAVIPSALKQKLNAARDFFEEKQRSLFAQIIDTEERSGARVVYANAAFLVFCPYASRAPFELAIWPRRAGADFHTISSADAHLLADAIRTALRRLNVALDHPAYHFTLTTAPARSGTMGRWITLDEDFRWHIEIVPRLRHSSAIDLATGSTVNGVWPEAAADHLRTVEVSA
jgi:UDPglucose--hexose-1-phosphate uridylyltransferase